MEKKALLYRITFYIVGMLLLAMGITLTTKTGLGVSPIISVPFCISNIFGLNFANVTFIVYLIFIILQIAIKKMNTEVFDLLQLVISVMFTRFLGLFQKLFDIQTDVLLLKFLLLLVAILLTGVGAAITMNARLIANPGDGIVLTISDASKKETGLVKNYFDLTCILISISTGLICERKIIGIGVGTMIAFVGVGRVIWAYNKLMKERIDILTDLGK